jgi:hypothetical protein
MDKCYTYILKHVVESEDYQHTRPSPWFHDRNHSTSVYHRASKRATAGSVAITACKAIAGSFQIDQIFCFVLFLSNLQSTLQMEQ